VKVHTIPETSLSAKGKHIVNLINIDKDERITAITHVREFSPDKYLFLVTKKAHVKKMSLDLFKNIRSTGIRAITLPDGDSLIGVLETNGECEIMLATKKGLSIRFHEKQVRPMGRTAYGIRGLRFKKSEDEVVSVEIVNKTCNVFTVTQKGYGKRAPCSQYRTQSRGGSGIINVRCGAKNGEVVSLKQLGKKDEVILVTDTGRTIRFGADDIPVQKRGGLGVKLMGLREEEAISGAAIIGEEE
jgi:DNA gyrase subunit A